MHEPPNHPVATVAEYEVVDVTWRPNWGVIIHWIIGVGGFAFAAWHLTHDPMMPVFVLGAGGQWPLWKFWEALTSPSYPDEQVEPLVRAAKRRWGR